MPNGVSLLAFGVFLGSGVSRVRLNVFLFPMKQVIRFVAITHICGSAVEGVDKSMPGVGAYVVFHAKVPLVPFFFGLAHVAGSFTFGVFG